MSSSAAAAAQVPEVRLPAWVAVVQAASRVTGVFAAGLILLSVFVVCQMVFVRAVLHESSIWQTEFVIFAVVASTFLGAPYILLTRGHVNVDVLPLMLEDPGRRLLHLVGSLIALAFCLFFLYAAVPWWYETLETGQTTPSIWRARLWIPYLSVPVGLALLSLQFIAEIYLVATHRGLPFGLSPEDHL